MEMYRKFPYMVVDVIHKCPVCQQPIFNKFEPGIGRYYPSSLYWNVEREEVYCGAEHSLVRHEEIKNGL